MRFTLIAAAAVATCTALAMDEAEQAPIEDPIFGQATSQGCFSARSGDEVDVEVMMHSVGTCTRVCEKEDEGYTVAIVGPSSCLCGKSYPPKDALVDDEECSYPCAGYPMEACGGLGGENGQNSYSVWNLGVEVNVPFANGESDGEEKPKDDDSKEDSGAGFDDDSKEDSGAGFDDDSKEDNGASHDDDEEHGDNMLPSPTSEGNASETASGTASVTSAPSATPSDDDSETTTEETASGTDSAAPAETTPADGAAAGRDFSMGAVAGGAFVAAVIAGAF